MAKKTATLTPPRQERSQKTLDRLLEACEGLLGEKPFEQVSVTELAERGRSSVGAFYGRFPGKEALLDLLEARGEEEVLKRWDDYFAREKGVKLEAEEILRRFVQLSVRAHRAKKGVVRALFLRLRGYPTPETLARARRMNRRVVAGMRELLASRSSEIHHPKPELAIVLGLVMVVATIREWVVFSDLELYPATLDDEALAEELARAFTAYLGIAPSRPRRRKK